MRSAPRRPLETMLLDEFFYRHGNDSIAFDVPVAVGAEVELFVFAGLALERGRKIEAIKSLAVALLKHFAMQPIHVEMPEQFS